MTRLKRYTATISSILVVACSTFTNGQEGGRGSLCGGDAGGLALLAQTGLGPEPFYNVRLTGDFVVAGSNTRGNYLDGVYPVPPAQTDPFTITISGIPSGSTIVTAFANWSYLANEPYPQELADITINGTPVTGVMTGEADETLCWDVVTSRTIAYTADVTNIVNQVGGNGDYIVGDIVDPLQEDPEELPPYLGEGFTLLIIYENVALPERQINVYRGMTIESHGGIADAVFVFQPGPYVSGPVHFFVNALDGQQDAFEEFYLNGINVGGILNGTVSADNAWQGLLGQGGVNSMYDHAEDDVSLFMVPYATELTIGTNGASSGWDCIGHSFAAVAFEDWCAMPPGGEDTDGDGVPDGCDVCPDTPACATVDPRGCPSDADDDGVFDGCDDCDDTPTCATVNASGCPSDTDGDGVWDGCDKCDDTPACATVDEDGCPSDADGDGVYDGCDFCPNTPACAEVNSSGCALDGDYDGVLNGCDLCPDTPACARDLVDEDGCVDGAYTDEDNDGVVDACDLCPGTPASWRPVDSDGCASCNDPNQDIEPDGDVDLTDFGVFAICFNGPNRSFNYSWCYCKDDDGDGDVDLADFAVFAACFNGPNRAHRCPGGASAPEGGGFAMSSLFGGESLLETVDVTFSLDSDQDQQTISAGTPVDWEAIVEVTGSNQGLASFAFDLELREGSATGPLAGVTLGTGVWDDAFAIAGPDGQPETGAALTATGSAGGPGMNALSSTGYNATPGLLQQIGAGYLTWDPWRLSEEDWIGNSTWGVGLDARKEALLLDALGSYSLVTGTIDTTNLDPGDYVLRLVPAANIGVLAIGIDLNAPAAGVTELTGAVSEPVTIEFTIGEE